MEEQDIQDMLDSLDIQLAKGQIDQPTYSTLTKKWQDKLQASKGSAVAVSGGMFAPLPNTPAPPEAVALECPKCGHPVKNLDQDLSKGIKCHACGHAFKIQESQDVTQRFMQELKTWLEQQMISSSAGASSSIDMNARRHIFNEDLFPVLKRDFDRRLGTLEDAPKAPMFPLAVMPGFRDYLPNPELVSVGQGKNEWLRRLSTRVSAPQIQDFAAFEADKQQLKALEFRLTTLIYYANIANFLESPGAPSYQLVQHNLQELQNECRAYAEKILDENHRSYLLALDARLSAALLLVEVLIPTLEEGRNFAPKAVLDQLDRALAQYAKAAQQAAASTYAPKYTVSLQQGIQKDVMLAQVFYAIVKCYEIVIRTRPVEFGAFYNHLIQYTRALVVFQSPDQLLGLVQSIERLLSARSGGAPVPMVADWSWLDAAIQANRRKATFGAAETSSEPVRHFHPYWVATLNYAEKQGIIFKSGTGRESLILIDATSVATPVVGYLLANDTALPVISAGMNNYSLLNKELMALPALLSRDMAEQAMKQFAIQHSAELGATVVNMIDLIYLPVAFVRYTGKNQTREMLLGRLNFVSQNLGQTLMQTYQFLQQYGA